MVPTSVTGFVVSLALLPRVLRGTRPAAHPRRRSRRPRRRAPVAGLRTPRRRLPASPSCPGLLLVAVGVALSFTPTTMVIASAVPETHAGLASGLAGSATQVGAALGTAAFTAIGIAVSGSAASGGTLNPSGFTAAFTAAAVVALATAALGCTIARSKN